MFHLCVCYQLRLTLDGFGFIYILYEQTIYWFNGCLNISYILYCSACNYFLNLLNKVLQYGLLA